MPNGGSVNGTTRSSSGEARTKRSVKPTIADEVQTLQESLSQAQRFLGTGKERGQTAKLLEKQKEMKRYGD